MSYELENVNFYYFFKLNLGIKFDEFRSFTGILEKTLLSFTKTIK